jgi:D-alanyl-lipoteichoic acid acyltransferase DltB (MBOAT superfamily)
VFLFLPLAIAGYWLLLRFTRERAAVGWLVACSLVFYACASLKSLAIVLPSILLDFALAKRFLSVSASRARERALLIGCGISANVLFLAYFKYHDFFSSAVDYLEGNQHILTASALPLGISFLTFQKIAFLCEVSAGQIQAVTFIDYLLFTSFFPRTVAGPIVHYREIIPQLRNTRPESMTSDIAVGFCLFSIGLFKKCVIAEGVASVVGRAFSLHNGIGPVALIDAWTGVLAYTLQLYFDFSGYSDMALGTARMVGIRLPMNFNSPLKATSMVDFWARWHITLTRFLTWYIYIPLVRRFTRARAARKRSLLRGPNSTPGAMVCLIAVPTGITMLISGVWHGVGWQFVVWGLLHGLYLAINQAWKLWRTRFWNDQASYDLVMKPVGFALTFGAVILGMVFFRASSVGHALSILAGMVGLHGIAPYSFQMLGHLGYQFDWTLVRSPWDALKWIALLFGMVMLCPNSLELMRRFQPALDFPIASQAPGTVPDTIPAAGPFSRLRQLWARAMDLGKLGLAFDGVTAAVVGALFTLGAMAMSRATTFLYGAF